MRGRDFLSYDFAVEVLGAPGGMWILGKFPGSPQQAICFHWSESGGARKGARW